ncbi:metallo-hydrolase oxidoreductase [Fusarium longipes]|uniref:Metallo-hydrolase oxidoreductase n=1 Tax=Fusarium longipes TaxID=694270 RepID=A0A395RWG1_9HYPO|nr:metallo-hydrolase oxidoreductase [Fusarium longipes]
MSALRVTNNYRLLALRQVRTRSTINSRAPQVLQRSTYATQGYGDAEGDPVGSNPKDQGPNSRATHEAEHPGPKPSSDKAKQKTPEDASAQSGGSRSKEAVEKGKSPTAGKLGGTD